MTKEEQDRALAKQYGTTYNAPKAPAKRSPLDFRYDPKTGQRQWIDPYSEEGGDPANAYGSVNLDYKNGGLARELYQRQLKQLQDFSANRNKYSDELYNSAASGARRQLDSTLRRTRDDFNSRGLLNSGMRIGAEEGARSNTASELAAKRKSINQGLLSQQEGMESNLFGSATNLARPGVDIAQPYLSGLAASMGIDMAAQSRDQEAAGGLAQGIGSLGGALAGTMFNQGKNKDYGYGGKAGSSAGNYGEMGRMGNNGRAF